MSRFTLLLLVSCLAVAKGCDSPPEPEVAAAEPGGTCDPGGTECLPDFAALYRRVAPSVLNVSASHRLQIPEGALPRRQRKLLATMVHSLGSGFVFDGQGHAVTCASVVQDAERLQAVLADGRRIEAELVMSDPDSDLAVLELNTDSPPPPLPLGDSTTVRPGQWVATVGFPYGLSHSMSAGVISAVLDGRESDVSVGLLLSDLSINPGSNGGPLVDLEGRVIGINSIPSGMEGGPGRAIAISGALPLLRRMAAGKVPARPWLGVTVQRLAEPLANSFSSPVGWGALVNRVFPKSPASAGGIRVGDIIVGFGGKPVRHPGDLAGLVKRSPTGRPVAVDVIRKGKRKKLSVVLVEK